MFKPSMKIVAQVAVNYEVDKRLAQLRGLPDSELTDDKLETICIQGHQAYDHKSFTGPMHQSDEVYVGMAAGRILEERHGEKYVLNLLKQNKKEGEK